MRLVNTETLQMHEFLGDYEEPYAILSHTWERDEVTFQEMVQTRDGTNFTKAQQIMSKAGYVKIRKAVATARTEGFQYIWIDTCCIDKTSSAELSEAINSMFRWYKMAALCIAYLADVEVAYQDASIPNQRLELKVDTQVLHERFRHSKWFTRGWTLQELIAPVHLRFYSMDWKFVGTKSGLADSLSNMTDINPEILKTGDPSPACIARRMSWASKRSTTRPEDMAYCLLGLFGVNMPLLYGEGDKAFQRLQEEIANRSDDHTLFAWKQKLDSSQREGSFALHRGLFARSPTEFANFSGYDERRALTYVFTPPSSITNIGLHTRLPLIPITQAHEICTKPLIDTSDAENEYLALLNYRDTRSKALIYRHARRYAIQLKKLLPDQDVYLRVRPDITYLVDGRETQVDLEKCVSDVIIQQTPKIYRPHLSLRLRGFFIRLSGPLFQIGSFMTTLQTAAGDVTVIDVSNPFFLPVLQDRAARAARAGLFGTVTRVSRHLKPAHNDMPLVIAFGIDTASPASVVCVYRRTWDDTLPLDLVESKRRAFSHGPGNVFIQDSLEDVALASVPAHGITGSSGFERYSLTASSAVHDDMLVCHVNIASFNIAPNTPQSVELSTDQDS